MQTPLQLNDAVNLIVDQKGIFIMEKKIPTVILAYGKYLREHITIWLLSSKSERDNYKSVEIKINVKSMLWYETKLSKKTKTKSKI